MASLEEGRLCLWWGFPGATFSPLTWAAPPASSSGCFHGLPPLTVAPTGGWTGCGPQVLGAGQSPHAPASFLPCSPACSRALPPASPGTPPSPRPSPAAPRVGSVFLLLRSCPGVARAQPENMPIRTLGRARLRIGRWDPGPNSEHLQSCGNDLCVFSVERARPPSAPRTPRFSGWTWEWTGPWPLLCPGGPDKDRPGSPRPPSAAPGRQGGGPRGPGGHRMPRCTAPPGLRARLGMYPAWW